MLKIYLNKQVEAHQLLPPGKTKKTPNPIEYSYSHNVHEIITTKYFPKGNLSIIKKELGENSKVVIRISSVQFSRSVVSDSANP